MVYFFDQALTVKALFKILRESNATKTSKIGLALLEYDQMAGDPTWNQDENVGSMLAAQFVML
jgi:hypothetical protein